MNKYIQRNRKFLIRPLFIGEDASNAFNHEVRKVFAKFMEVVGKNHDVRCTYSVLFVVKRNSQQSKGKLLFELLGDRTVFYKQNLFA